MKRRIFIQTLVLSSGYIVLNPRGLKGMSTDKNMVKILMIYNNTGKSSTLKSAWGLSVWIEKYNSATLFDTGGDASIFLENISNTDVNLDNLSNIVISHNHWDHKKGLDIILEKTSNKPLVYVVENDFTEYSRKFPNAKIRGVSGAINIDTNIWTTGKLKASFREKELFEQSLILTRNDSMILLTGCSHSGIVDMVKTIKKIFPDKIIKLVAGGFHLNQHSDSEIMKISNELKDLKVDKIAPSHCTGDSAIDLFKTEWGDKFIDLNLGNSFSV